MAFLSALGARARALLNENPKGPWGTGGGSSGGGSGGGGDNGGGPRSPWSIPPSGPRGPRKPTALDELMRQMKRGGGHLPGGAQARSLWIAGAAVVIGLWIVVTSFHAIGPQERGVVTYFGKYAGTLEPGIRMTLPAPISAVRTIDVQKINTEDFPETGTDNLMLTGDQNIVDIAYSVRWDVRSPQDYAFQIANSRDTVRATAESAMRAVISSTRLDAALGAGRNDIEYHVGALMQQILDDYNSGIRIQGVAIKKADPPGKVIEDFKKVSAADQQAQAAVNQANTYAQAIIARAQGEAVSFNKTYEQYKLAPEVTRRRMYYETMEQVLAKSNKTVVDAPGVTPYLPLPELKRRPEAPTPIPTTGAGQ